MISPAQDPKIALREQQGAFSYVMEGEALTPEACVDYMHNPEVLQAELGRAARTLHYREYLEDISPEIAERLTSMCSLLDKSVELGFGADDFRTSYVPGGPQPLRNTGALRTGHSYYSEEGPSRHRSRKRR